MTNIEFMLGGQRAWGTRGTNTPFMLSLKKGENVESKLRELSAGPSYAFFGRIELPKLVVKPGQGVTNDRPTLGQSYLFK